MCRVALASEVADFPHRRLRLTLATGGGFTDIRLTHAQGEPDGRVRFDFDGQADPDGGRVVDSLWQRGEEVLTVHDIYCHERHLGAR